MAKPKPEGRVSTLDLRANLSSFRYQVQFEGVQIPVYCYERLVAGVVPVAIAESWELDKTQTCRMTDLRPLLTDYCNQLQSGLDVVWVTMNGDRAFALVSPRAWREFMPPETAPQPSLEYQLSCG
jgi:hypothetical protein